MIKVMYSLWRQGRYPLQRPHLPHLHIAQEQHRPDIAMMQILTKSVFLFFSTCWNCFCACVYKSLAEEVFTIVFKSTSRASINEPWKLFSSNPSLIIALPCQSVSESALVVRLEWCYPRVWRYKGSQVTSHSILKGKYILLMPEQNGSHVVGVRTKQKPSWSFANVSNNVELHFRFC